MPLLPWPVVLKPWLGAASAGLAIYLALSLVLLNPLQHPVLRACTKSAALELVLLLPVSVILLNTTAGIIADLLVVAFLLLLVFCLLRQSRLSVALFNLLPSLTSAQLSYNLLVSLCYCSLFIAWQLSILIAPGFILHGSLLLFSRSGSALGKLALMFILAALLKLAMLDLAAALLWQKVLLMLGTGIVMLAAAFWYQKRHSDSQEHVA